MQCSQFLPSKFVADQRRRWNGPRKRAKSDTRVIRHVRRVEYFARPLPRLAPDPASVRFRTFRAHRRLNSLHSPRILAIRLRRPVSVIAKAPWRQVILWPMPTVAEQLRQAREEQKLNVYQVAEITKIKTDHIRALESGAYDSFSAPVYIRGFVRSYAKVLKLDLAHITADLETELSQTEKFSAPPPLTDRPKGVLDFLMLQFSKLSWPKAVGGLAGLLVLIIILAVVKNFGRKTASDPLKNLGPGLYQPKPDSSGETLPLPTPPPRRP